MRSAQQNGVKDILSLVPPAKRRGLVPVSPIEADASGLVILTNERHAAQRLSKRDDEHVKEWVVDVEGSVPWSKVEKLAKGLILDGETDSLKPVCSFLSCTLSLSYPSIVSDSSFLCLPFAGCGITGIWCCRSRSPRQA